MTGSRTRVPAPVRRGDPAGPVRTLVAILGVVLFLAPRLWRIEAVGEGLDEEASVYATRAMAEGRFSLDGASDVRGDEYQSRFCPVPEAVAVPFLRTLGDRALAFRLPWTFAALVAAFLLVRAAFRRWGVVAAIVVFALFAFDPKNVSYSQAHRYVVLEGLFCAAFVLASLRASATARMRDGALAAIVGGLALHTHLLSVFVLFGVTTAMVIENLRALPRRFPRHLVPFALLLVHAGVMLALFRNVVDPRFFATREGGSTLVRSASYFVRMLGNLGPVTGPLGLVGGVLLARSARSGERLLGTATLVTTLAYPLATIVADVAPRYLLCLQPAYLLCAAAAGARLVDRFRPRTAVLAATLLLLAAPSAALTSWVLTTGGGRDEEQRLNADLERLARPGDGVLYVDQYRDPYHRRPKGLTSIARVTATGPDPRRLDAIEGTVYIVAWSRYLDAPLFTPEFRARLETVRSLAVTTLFQDPTEITLFRLRR